MGGFCIHSASLCFLVGVFNPFTFKVQFSCLVVSDSLWPHGLQHTKPPCPSPIPGVYSNSFPLSRWCHPTISSSVIPFSSCFQSFPASGSFQRNQFFASGGQSIGVSASTSVLPMNIQDWFPLEWTGWISLSCYCKIILPVESIHIGSIYKMRNVGYFKHEVSDSTEQCFHINDCLT